MPGLQLAVQCVALRPARLLGVCRVRMADFGCAGQWVRKAPPKQRQRMKTYVGTPAYMAPQVLESAFYPTHTYSATEADVWSLGILLANMFFDHHTPYW